MFNYSNTVELLENQLTSERSKTVTMQSDFRVEKEKLR